MFVQVLAAAILFLEYATPSLAVDSSFTVPGVLPPVESSGGLLSILPASTQESITLPQATTGLFTTTGASISTPVLTGSISGIMSIPPGETPLTTASSVSGAETPSKSASGTGAVQSSGVASPNAIAHGSTQFLSMMVFTGLSVTLGFAWALL